MTLFRVTDINMLFNFGKKSGGSSGGKGKAIEINVNGKTLTADPGHKAVNLRKELIKNKIDVYSLRGKFDNCGGSGICGRCAVEVVDGNICVACKRLFISFSYQTFFHHLICLPIEYIIQEIKTLIPHQRMN